MEESSLSSTLSPLTRGTHSAMAYASLFSPNCTPLGYRQVEPAMLSSDVISDVISDVVTTTIALVVVAFIWAVRLLRPRTPTDHGR